MPYVIEKYTDNIYITTWFGNNKMGQIIVGIIVTYFILFPLATVRNLSSLISLNISSSLICVYLSLAITVIFFSDKQQVPSAYNNLS